MDPAPPARAAEVLGILPCLTFDELCVIARFGKRTGRELYRNGLLPPAIRGLGRRLLWRPETVRDWLVSLEGPGRAT